MSDRIDPNRQVSPNRLQPGIEEVDSPPAPETHSLPPPSPSDSEIVANLIGAGDLGAAVRAIRHLLRSRESSLLDRTSTAVFGVVQGVELLLEEHTPDKSVEKPYLGHRTRRRR